MGSVNDYLLEVLVADHLREARAAAGRHALAAELTPPLRVAVGHALIRIGRRLASRRRRGAQASALCSALPRPLA